MSFYPPNDEWTEPEYVDWGTWIVATSGGTLSLDSVQKVVRDHSIRCSGGDYGAEDILFTLKDGLEANADLYPRLLFLVMASNPGASIRVQLEDTAGMIVRKDESLIVSGEWKLITMPVGTVNDAYWEKDVFNTQPFNWAAVKKIRLVCYQTLHFWVDGIHFTYKVEGLRALGVTVVVKGTDPPVPITQARVVYGFLVGVNPETGKETYLWMDGEAKITGADGRVVFSELDPDWYGIRVSAKGFKEIAMGDIDLTDADKAVTAYLEVSPIEDLLKFLTSTIAVGGLVVATTVTIRKL